MMPQREADEQIHAQVDQDYGRYEGDQTYARSQETPYQQPAQERSAGKVYAPASDNKNVLRLIAFGMALVTLLAFGVLCLIFVGGSAGWISFCAASLAIFIIATVAIDKIK